VVPAILHAHQEDVAFFVVGGIPVARSTASPVDFVYVDQLSRLNPFHDDFDAHLTAQHAPVSSIFGVATRKPRHAEEWPALESVFLDHAYKDVRGALEHLVFRHVLGDVEF
jgi:hypothetical protein